MSTPIPGDVLPLWNPDIPGEEIQAGRLGIRVRPGTPAAESQHQIDEATKAQRLAALFALLEEQRLAFNRRLVGRRAAVYVRGCINSMDDQGDALYFAAAHGADKVARDLIREMISEFRKVMQEESELSPREIKAVCRVLPDAYYAEVRKRAVHTPAQGEGSA